MLHPRPRANIPARRNDARNRSPRLMLLFWARSPGDLHLCWVKSAQWGLRNIMLVWTGCFVLEIISAAMHPAQFQQIQIWQAH